VLCSNFVKFSRREIGKIVRCLSDKKILLALQLSLLRGSRPKSARASPRQRTQSSADFIQVGSLSAEFYPNAWTPSARSKVNPIYAAEAYSFETNHHILIIGSICLCHSEHASYFIAPCEPPARPARIPLGDTLCAYSTVLSVSSAL